MPSQEFLQKLRLPDLESVSQYFRGLSTSTLISMGAITAATTLYMATRPKALPAICDLKMQSIEIPVSLGVTLLECEQTFALFSILFKAKACSCPLTFVRWTSSLWSRFMWNILPPGTGISSYTITHHCCLRMN